MKFFDRLLTIIITATLTSAVWIVFGSTLMTLAEGNPSTPAAEEVRVEEGKVLPAPATEPFPTGDEGETGDAREATQNEKSAPASDTSLDGALVIPVEGVAPGDLIDSFYEPRGENGVRRHEAIDIMAPRGTAVLAAAPGKIARIHSSKAGGRSIYVRSSDRETLYFYGHLDAYADGLEEGSSIKAGEALGRVGTTGNAEPDAPHLHFAIFQTTADAEWWEPGNAVNPYPLLATTPD
jgi:murein DD-endopeptidase MepM/ murein hydrolase activator NlpD